MSRAVALLVGLAVVGGATSAPASTGGPTSPSASTPVAVWPPAFWFDPVETAPGPVRGEVAMVAAAHDLAAIAGRDVLRAGGTAADAAVAVQMVLNAVEPQSSGIGGGCFIVYWPPGADRPITIDGRETAPASATATLFLRPDGTPVPVYPDRITGGRPVGVPGTLAALAHLHGQHGALDWDALFAPAIAVCDTGVIVSRRLEQAIAQERARLAHFEASRALYLDADGAPLAEGTRLRLPDLARTFRLVAAEGADVFYHGEIAADVVATVRDAALAPGLLTLDDLAGYEALEREPVQGRYRGLDVWGMGPPSSGGTTVIEALQILDGFDLGRHRAGSADAVHLVIEALKLAFADRNRYVGDPDRTPIPTGTLVSTAFAERRRAEIHLDRALDAPARAAIVRPSSTETTHFVVRDAAGGMLSMTTTIEWPFGSGMVVPGRGFLLNNELTDFDAIPVLEDGTPGPNRVGPGRRPRSSMAPTIVSRDGTPILALGSPGGTRIIGVTLNVLLHVVDWGMDVQRAIDFPRALDRGRGESELEILYWHDDLLRARYGVSGTRAALEALGHEIWDPDPAHEGVGGVHAIEVRPDGTVWGGADPRREGRARGY